MTGGKKEGDGGGIYNHGGLLILTDSTVSGNSADFGIGNGGGIYNYGGTLTLTNSTVSAGRTTGERASI